MTLQSPRLLTIDLGAMIVFDLLSGFLLAGEFLSIITPFHRQDAEPSAYVYELKIIDHANGGISGLGAVYFLAAAICLFRLIFHKDSTPKLWKSILTAQKRGFWCFILITVILLSRLMLPSEGGVGGFLTMAAFVLFLIFTVIACMCVISLKNLERENKPE